VSRHADSALVAYEKAAETNSGERESNALRKPPILSPSLPNNIIHFVWFLKPAAIGRGAHDEGGPRKFNLLKPKDVTAHYYSSPGYPHGFAVNLTPQIFEMNSSPAFGGNRHPSGSVFVLLEPHGSGLAIHFLLVKRIGEENVVGKNRRLLGRLSIFSHFV
jgi:hypothetical protein